MKTIRGIQLKQQEWAKRHFGDCPSYLPLLGIVEEVGELSHSHLKQSQGIRGDNAKHIADAKDAVGDIVIFLMDYCNRRGWDLQEIIEDTWDEVSKRKWNVAGKGKTL